MTRRTAWGSAWERPISRSARAAGTGCARKCSMSKSENQERLLQGESLGSGMLGPSTKSTSDALSQAGLRMKQTAGKPAKAARRQKRLLRSTPELSSTAMAACSGTEHVRRLSLRGFAESAYGVDCKWGSFVFGDSWYLCLNILWDSKGLGKATSILYAMRQTVPAAG